MLTMQKSLADTKAMKRKIDQLLNRMEIAGLRFSHLDVGDFMTTVAELEKKAKDQPHEKMVEDLRTDIMPLSLGDRLDKADLLRIGNHLKVVIDWLEGLEVEE